MRCALFVAAAVVTAAAPPLLRAQSAGSPGPADSRHVALALFAGAGGTLALSQAGADRTAGPALLAGIELARPASPGLAGRLALRAEAGFAAQDIAANQGAVSGDVHTVHAALVMSLAFPGWSAGGFVPYALAGAVSARPSTRFVLAGGSAANPVAGFEQITHEQVAGAIVGAGVSWHLRLATLRAEARWMGLATGDRASTTLPLVVTLAVPLHRGAAPSRESAHPGFPLPSSNVNAARS